MGGAPLVLVLRRVATAGSPPLRPLRRRAIGAVAAAGGGSAAAIMAGSIAAGGCPFPNTASA